MQVVRVRIAADSREQCEQTIQYLASISRGAIKIGKPRKGRKNGTNGAETWLAYGEIDLDQSNARRGVPL